MAEISVTKCLGLLTVNNPFSVREGALILAQNVVVKRVDIAENRRGYENYATATGVPEQTISYSQKVSVHADSKIQLDNGSGSLSAYDGSFDEVVDVTTTGTTTNTSAVITNIANIQKVEVGQIVVGTGIPAGSYVTALAGTSVTISQACTASGTVSIVFKSRKIYYQNANSNSYLCTDGGVKVLQDVIPPIVTTGISASGSNTITNVANLNGVYVGKLISGTGIPSSTYVAEIYSSSVVMTKNATANATGNITFTSSYRLAGVPRALGPKATVVTGSTFATGVNVAYRTIIQRVDQNQNVIVSYPSERVWVPNTSGSDADIELVNYLPAGTRASDVLQVYRTPTASGSSDDTAGDEEGLIYQQTLLQSDINAGTVTVTDSVVDALIGATIYTAPSQEGIAQANAQPPLAKDIALFKGYMFYANTETKQILYTNLVSVTDLYNSGSYGRTVIIAGTTYTSAATENSASGAFAVSNSGTTAVDIDETARSLVRIINSYSSNTSVYAYYLSTPDTLPGQIVIESRTVGTSSFTISVGSSSTSGDFFPQPLVSPSSNAETTSSNQIKQNGIYVSKADQLEAVPLVNLYLVGAANAEIFRIVPLRDSLIIIKADGVFRITGETIQSFSVTPVDLTVICKAINSVAQLANNVIMLANQGFVAISDTGVEVISRDIEPNVLPLLTYPNVPVYTSAVGYESERLYLVSTVSEITDTSATQLFCYNIFTKAWTTWDINFVSAVVEPAQDKLYFTLPDEEVLFQERKNFEDLDYADPSISCTITAIDTVALTATITVSGATPLVGWVLEQGSTGIKITDVTDEGGGSFLLDLYQAPPDDWAAGAATLYPGIEVDLEWDTFYAGEAGYLKQLQLFKVLMDNTLDNNTTTSVDITFRTDLSTTRVSEQINSESSAWGVSPWGEFPWGGESQPYAYITYPPKEKAYFRAANFGIQFANAQEKLSLSGYSATLVPVSERTNR